MDGKGDKDKKDVYYELRQIMEHLDNIVELLLPPKEIRNEFRNNLKEAEINLLKAVKVIIDYKIEELSKSKSGNKRQRAQRIKVE